MKLKLFFPLALLFFASCKDNITEPQMTEPEENASKFFITATINDGFETKTTVEYGNTDYATGEKSL